MDALNQFDIWFARLPMNVGSHVQGGTRPVIIFSNTEANRNSPIVSVVPLTSKPRKHPFPTHVLLFADGLTTTSRALCEQLTTIDKSQLIRRVGAVSSDRDRAALNRAVATQFGLVA